MVLIFNAVMHLIPVDADGTARSVGPDHTDSSKVVWSGSALFAQTSLPKYLELLRL